MAKRFILSWLTASLIIVGALCVWSLFADGSVSHENLLPIIALWCLYVGSYVAVGLFILSVLSLPLRSQRLSFPSVAICLMLAGVILGWAALGADARALGTACGATAAAAYIAFNWSRLSKR
jgi:hypothetical protein